MSEGILHKSNSNRGSYRLSVDSVISENYKPTLMNNYTLVELAKDQLPQIYGFLKLIWDRSCGYIKNVSLYEEGLNGAESQVFFLNFDSVNGSVSTTCDTKHQHDVLEEPIRLYFRIRGTNHNLSYIPCNPEDVVYSCNETLFEGAFSGEEAEGVAKFFRLLSEKAPDDIVGKIQTMQLWTREDIFEAYKSEALEERENAKHTCGFCHQFGKAPQK